MTDPRDYINGEYNAASPTGGGGGENDNYMRRWRNGLYGSLMNSAIRPVVLDGSGSGAMVPQTTSSMSQIGGLSQGATITPSVNPGPPNGAAPAPAPSLHSAMMKSALQRIGGTMKRMNHGPDLDMGGDPGLAIPAGEPVMPDQFALTPALAPGLMRAKRPQAYQY